MITYTRQAGDAEGFVLVPDGAPPSLTSPATSSSSSPPTPPTRPVPGAPEPDPLPDRLPGPATPDPRPDRHAEPVTAPLWKKLTRWVLRVAFKKKLWAHLGQHLKTLKALGLGAAPGASRRRGGLLRVGSGLTSHHPPPNTAPYAVRMLPTGVGAGMPRKKLERRRGQGPRLGGRREQESDGAGERFGTGDANAV